MQDRPANSVWTSTYCEVLYLTKKTTQMFAGATLSRNVISDNHTHSFSHIYKFETGHPVVYIKLYNILCTVNTQHTSRQDAIITIRLCLATCFGRDRPSSDQLRTILRYSKNSTQWDHISFTLELDRIWRFSLMIKAVRIFILYQVLMWTKCDPTEYYFYCTLILFLLGLKMAGHGRNM